MQKQKFSLLPLYSFFPNFIMRNPLMPFDFIRKATAGSDIAEDELKEIYSLPEIKESVIIASPSLYERLENWLCGNIKDKKQIEQLHDSMMKYLSRMSTRCTPFGLFAGFSIGAWSDKNNITLKKGKRDVSHTRLDMNYLCSLAQDLSKMEIIRENIKFYPNTSRYLIGDQLRYIEYGYIKTMRKHNIVAVDHSEYLDRIFAASKNGAYIKDLVPLLLEGDITEEISKDFILELIDSQLLTNELEPAVSGPEFLHQIIDVLKNLDGIDNIKKILNDIIVDLENLDGKEIGDSVADYDLISQKLKELDTEFERKYLFQTDMVKAVKSCQLDRSITQDIMQGIEILNKLTPKSSETNLTKFRDAFYKRYEEKEIPLLEALDVEMGIGYLQNNNSGDISPVIDDIAAAGRAEDNDSYKISWNKRQSILLKKYMTALKDGKSSIELTDDDLKSYEAAWDDLPYTISSMITVYQDKNDENKELIYLGHAGGSSSANLLGRFCHSCPETDQFVKEMKEKEESLNKDVIFAEIIHLPESRTGNVLLHPVFHKYEIPYLAKSAVAPEFQLDLQDLLVSVKYNQKVILRSKRLNKEIIPRLSNAHNFSHNALPVYQFLCDLQNQQGRGGVGFGFGWGQLFESEFNFLPRVTYKNLIFSLASWKIEKDDLKKILAVKNDGTKMMEEVTIWREKFNIPEEVALADSDNELYLKLTNLRSVKSMLSVVKNRPDFKLIEFPYNHDNALVKGDDGVYTNQFVVSFYKNETKK